MVAFKVNFLNEACQIDLSIIFIKIMANDEM